MRLCQFRGRHLAWTEENQTLIILKNGLILEYRLLLIMALIPPRQSINVVDLEMRPPGNMLSGSGQVKVSERPIVRASKRKCQPSLPKMNIMAPPKMSTKQDIAEVAVKGCCYSRPRVASSTETEGKRRVDYVGVCLTGGSTMSSPPPAITFHTWTPTISGLITFERPILGTPGTSLLTKNSILTGGLRYLQHYFATMAIVQPKPTINLDDDDAHNCIFCTCNCAPRSRYAECSLDLCDHCQYYPESTPGWCLGEHGERSGNIAFLLRNAIKCDVPTNTLEDKRFQSFIHLFPLNFSMIEEIRRLFREQPFDCRPTMLEEIEVVTGLPDNIDINTALQANGYAEYKVMLSSPGSAVTPHPRDLWDEWVQNPKYRMSEAWVRTLDSTSITGPVGPTRQLYYVLVEIDQVTGTLIQHISPRMPLAAGITHLRFSITPRPEEKPLPEGVEGSSAPVNTYRVFVRRPGATTQTHRDDQKVVCPMATIESTPLRRLYHGSLRRLYYIVEGAGREEADVLQLGDQDNYLRIHFS